MQTKVEAKVRQETVFKLAKKIADLLIEHSSPSEAEAACMIAKELASLNLKQCSLLVRTRAKT